MKKLLLFGLILLLLLGCMACAAPQPPALPVPPDEAEQKVPAEAPEEDVPPSQPEPTLTPEAAASRAAAYYPAGVELRYDEPALISGITYGAVEGQAWCYLFTVYAGDGRRVSRAAVDMAEGGLWFVDMYTVEEAEVVWFREDFMSGAYPGPEVPRGKNEPYMEFSHGNNGYNLYLANVDFIPEFTYWNEGGATWSDAEQRLCFQMTKVTGSVSGTADGPYVRMVVVWEDGKPRIVEKEFRPAPIYSNPREVLGSEEIIFIEDERLLEVAEVIRGMFLNYQWRENM